MKFLLLPLMALIILSGCSVQKQSDNPTKSQKHITSPTKSQKPISTKNESIDIDMLTTKNVPTAITQEKLIENGVSFKLSNKEVVSPSGLVENLTFANVGLAGVKVPKVTTPTAYFFITQKNKVWFIKGIMGAELDIKGKTNDLPSEFSKLAHSSMSVKNIGNFTEFYDTKHLLTIGKVKVSGIPLPEGEKIQLDSGQQATFFKEGNINGVDYPVMSGSEREWIVVAGNFDKKSIISLAKSNSIYRYVNKSNN
jgi:hypothetical protein